MHDSHTTPVFELNEYHLSVGRVYLYGEVNECSALKLVQELSYLQDNGYKEIYLYINSWGGFLDDCVCICDKIAGLNKLKINVYTIACGCAHSSAAFILCFGKERYITENSSIMLHPVSFSLDEDYSVSQKAATDFFNSQYEKFMSKISKLCGREHLEMLNEVKNGLWMDCNASIKYGVVDKIWNEKEEQWLLNNLPIRTPKDDSSHKVSSLL